VVRIDDARCPLHRVERLGLLHFRDGARGAVTVGPVHAGEVKYPVIVVHAYLDDELLRFLEGAGLQGPE
jgi:hypothetical protein